MSCQGGRPRVSVLMPVHNGGNFLQTAVDSILQQSLHDLELILIDDHSTDNAIGSLGATDDRLRITSSPGRGIVAALNHGATLARGAFLARMDADDISLPQRLERQIALLEADPGLGIVACEVEIFAEQGIGEGYRKYQQWINKLRHPIDIAREMFIESPIPHPTAVIRKVLFEQLGGYRDSAWAEDYDLWLRAHVLGVRMAKPAGVLLRWRDHGQRLSRHDDRYGLAQFTRAKAHYLAQSVLRERSAVIWGAAPTGAALHDALHAEGVAIEAFIDIDPKKIGGRKRGLPVWPAERAVDAAPALILGAVGSRGARETIRDAMRRMALTEGTDYLFTA